MRQSTEVEPRQLKNLERKFLAFLQDVSLRPGPKRLHIYGGRTYGRNCAFLGWGDETFSDVIAATRKLCPNISDKRIANVLRDLMVKIFEDQAVSENADPEADADLEAIIEVLDTSNIRQELLEVVQSLRRQERPQVVFVPIEGLTLKKDNLTVGTVVLRCRHQESELDRALRSLEERVGKEPSIWEDLENATCYAAVEAIGDDDFVRDEAVRRVTEAIHILNLYLSSSRHQTYWASIRIARVIINRTLPADDSERDRIGFRQSFPGRQPLELDWKTEQRMVEWGLRELNACFQPQNNTKIAKRIRRVVTWYGKAVDADSPEEKFVSLAIALESLLIGHEEKGPYTTTGGITQKLRERVAFLLGDDFDSRMQISKATGDLYGLRSKIVHQGEQIELQELAEMDNLVTQVTLAFLKHNFTSWSAFQEWVARQRYG